MTETTTTAWGYRGICANPAGRGRVYYWTPPGGCGNPADGSGLEVQQRVTRSGYGEAPYRVFDRKRKTLLPSVYDTLAAACLAAEAMAGNSEDARRSWEEEADLRATDWAAAGHPVLFVGEAR